MPAQPPLTALIGILQQLRQQRDLGLALQLHAYLTCQSLESHPVLGNYLVPMLVACSTPRDAQHAFDRLPNRNEHSWTCLISGYIESGDPQQVFLLYGKMQEEEHLVQPNRVTYLALLSACAVLKDAEKGLELHTDITKRGFDGDVSIRSESGNTLAVGNTLVSMYGKCGLLMEAKQVFDRLQVRDTVSWTALITGYTEHGLDKQGLDCLKQMRFENVPANAVTFVLCVKACAVKGSLETGRELHGEIKKSGLRDSFLLNMLVDMYGKCGSINEAQEVFDAMSDRDVISWNALITAYAEHGADEDVLNCYGEMQREGISPDSTTFVCSLKVCHNVETLKTGQDIHSEVTKRALERALYVGSALINLYSKCALLAEARQVLDSMAVRNAVSWSALIAGYTDHGLYEEVLNCVRQMQLEGILVDAVTLVLCLKACGIAAALDTGWNLHTEIIRRGFEKKLNVASTLVGMYGKCNMVVEARRVFDRLPVRNTAFWTALITGYAEHQHIEEMLSCLKQMQLEGVSANAVTFVPCLKACGATGSLETGREIHSEIRKSGLESDLFLGNMLVDMYGKCGSVTEGREVFDNLCIRDVISWTAMIKTYGENHQGSMAVQCFEEMQEQGVKPDSITFSCLLAACSQANLVFEGQQYFKRMQEEYGIEPTSEHYAGLVDLFARAGQVNEAEKVLVALKCPPTNIMLLSLLSACKMYGRVELGQACFQHLVEANQDNATAYMLMADLYAHAGRWTDANGVEEMRKYAGAKKRPGSALIEVNRSLHEFVVGVRDMEFYVPEQFEVWNLHIKGEGYVPN